jgi:hypothetical protein
MVCTRINTGMYTQTKGHILVAMMVDVDMGLPIEVGVVVTLASELRRSFSAGHDECGENFHLGVFGLGRRRFLACCSASDSRGFR